LSRRDALSGPGSTRPRRCIYGGVSAVAGAVFLVIIIITLMTGVIFWSITTQRELNEFDLRRASQELVIDHVEFGAGVVRIYVNNTGAEAVHVVAVWFIDKTTKPEKHYRVGEDRIDRSWVPEGAYLWEIRVYWSAKPGHVYEIKLITDLGRAFVSIQQA